MDEPGICREAYRKASGMPGTCKMIVKAPVVSCGFKLTY
jgi:hypothetical protein